MFMVLGQRGEQVFMCVPGGSVHPFLTQGGQHGLSLCVVTHVRFPLDGSNPDLITREKLPEPAGSTEALLGGWYRVGAGWLNWEMHT